MGPLKTQDVIESSLDDVSKCWLEMLASMLAME